MKVKAKCNIKYGAEWITSGTEFDIPENMYGLMREMVDPVVVVHPEKEPEPEEEPAPAPAPEPDAPDEAEPATEGAEAETPKPRKAAPKPRRTTSGK